MPSFFGQFDTRRAWVSSISLVAEVRFGRKTQQQDVRYRSQSCA